MQKSAAEILAPVQTKVDYRQISRRRAKDCQHILGELLNNQKLLRELSRDFQVLEKGYPVQSDYPHWAYEIAYKLYDPKGRFGAAGKEGLVNLCQAMLDEFGTEDQYFTRNIAENSEVPFLARVAKDFLGAD